MTNNSFWLTMSDHTEIYVQAWTPDKPPKALVQIAHGMADHINRYHTFGSYLINNGIVVFGNDHRGHGQTGQKASSLGFLGETDGFERVVDDLAEVTKHMKKQFPNTPLFLLGHSFGSFLSRRYIQKYSDMIDGVILIGTGHQSPISLSLVKIFAKQHAQRKGITTPSDFFNNLIFGSYKKAVKEADSDFDWLTRDKEEVKSYIEDPYTGFVPSTLFYYDMFHGMSLMEKRSFIHLIRKDLPLLFLTGTQDPVANFGKAVKYAIAQYQKACIHNIENILYPGARHELLNETNKLEVFQDIVNWVNQTINKYTK